MHDVSCRDWPGALGVIHTATRAEPSRAEPSRTVLNRIDSAWKNKPTLLYGSVFPARRTEPNPTQPNPTEPNRTGPSLIECVQWLMFVCHKAMKKYRPATIFEENECLKLPLLLGSQSC